MTSIYQKKTTDKKIEIITAGENNLYTTNPLIKKFTKRNRNNQNVHFTYKHYCKFILYNYFITKIKGTSKIEVLFFFEINSNYFGYQFSVYEDIISFTKGLLENSISINMDVQLSHLEKFSKCMIELRKPISKGLFEHTIPPIDDENIREIWQKAILTSFNNYGISLLKDQENKPLSNIKITWNITSYSLLDLAAFKNWLEELKEAAGTINIERYILVDITKYKDDSQYEYRFLVNDIVQNHFNDDAYKYYFIDSHHISDEYKNDYSIFKYNDNEKIVQGAIIEENNLPRLLKVYFSQEFDDIVQIEKLFSYLDVDLDNKHKASSFEKLLEKKGLTYKENKIFKWDDWVAQEQNSIFSYENLTKQFSELSPLLPQNAPNIKIKATPYLLSLIKKDEEGKVILNDPILKQYFPEFSGLKQSNSNISVLSENWEEDSEMITPILQHKHYNRVLLRIHNSCLSYCSYCFEAKRVLDSSSKKRNYTDTHFENSLTYIRNHSELEEVIISGGEPLSLNDSKIEYILSSIRTIPHIKSIRIHTKALVHNPFRFTNDLIFILKKFNVTAIVFSYYAFERINKHSHKGN